MYQLDLKELWRRIMFVVSLHKISIDDLCEQIEWSTDRWTTSSRYERGVGRGGVRQ